MGQPTAHFLAVNSGKWAVGGGKWAMGCEIWADKPQPTAHFLPCRIHKSMGSAMLEVGWEMGGIS